MRNEEALLCFLDTEKGITPVMLFYMSFKQFINISTTHSGQTFILYICSQDCIEYKREGISNKEISMATLYLTIFICSLYIKVYYI